MTEEIPVLYEDGDTLVIDKPAGLLSEASETAPSVIGALLSHSKDGFLAPITRLDREVSGVMLLAKNKKSAAYYTAQMADKTTFQKEYLALVTGTMEEKSGTLTDLLFKDSARNKSFVVTRMRRGVKEASLSYDVVAEKREEQTPLSLVHICLHTGRTHQIRVQLSHRRHPLVGDKKYGGAAGFPMGLLSYRLTFKNTRGRVMTLVSDGASRAPFDLFADFSR